MKTNFDKKYKTNKNLELDGVEIPFEGGASFRVKRFGGRNSQNMVKIMSEISKPYARQVELGILDPGVDRELAIRAFVKCCLVDWKGVFIDDKEVPFSEDTAVALFMEVPDLLAEIQSEASKIDNYRENLGNF